MSVSVPSPPDHSVASSEPTVQRIDIRRHIALNSSNSGISIGGYLGAPPVVDGVDSAAPRLAFVCVQNAGRSQMAAAFARRAADRREAAE
jgi:hypothetical protein